MAAEIWGVGERADDSVARWAVWVSHQALVSALWCSNRTPHLQNTQEQKFQRLREQHDKEVVHATAECDSVHFTVILMLLTETLGPTAQGVKWN